MSRDYEAIRARLAAAKPGELWRSLDELCGSAEFDDYLHHEFPRLADVWDEGVDRRAFLKLAAASIALGGAAACARVPLQNIVPYVVKPQAMTQGEPLYFATTLVQRGYGFGVIAKSYMGRPVKLEGNPAHPASVGAMTPFAEAAILDLYDPARAQAITRTGAVATWDDFNAELVAVMRRAPRLRILTQTVTSPALIAQIQALLRAHPGAKWHGWDPLQSASGLPLDPVYHFDRADVVLALDSDFLSGNPRYSRDFANRRRAGDPQTSTMNRLYVVEPMPTVTGSMADHRFPIRASEVAAFAAEVLAGRGAVASDLQAHRGAAIVVPGDMQPPAVHAMAHAINADLAAPVTYIDPVAAQVAPLRELVDDLNAGLVDVLLVIGGNPAYDAPADFDFAHAMRRAPFSVHLTPFANRTSALARWMLPESHALEQWTDARAFDGTTSIGQPLIAPLYESRSAHEVVAMFAGMPMQGADILRAYWRAQWSGEFDGRWQEALSSGVVADSASPSRPLIRPSATFSPLARGEGTEISFRADPTILDGRHSNNGWLQELPKPITRLVWGTAAFMAPRLAEKLGVDFEDMVEVAVGPRKIELPVWIVPGHADNAVTLHRGYGSAESLYDGQPFTSGSIRNVHRKAQLTSTQHHNQTEGRGQVRAATLEEYRRNPDFVRDPESEVARDESMYPNYTYRGHKWAMSIDLSACTGCSACVVACNAENNIPVVGQDQVERGREMQWLRIDRYYEGPVDNPRIYHEPVLCMHCEDAPCEVVCPVGATVHSSEGLNEMIYNRCVGTRYCSNNCPYKVRRFNFLSYTNPRAESLELMRNPDVTVRVRGVMEKCSYCVQRIEHARINAANEHRAIRDGEIVTACQAACPAEAIVFGDANDPASRVSRLKRQKRDFGILTELNTRPRTTYLAKLTNPNPDVERGRPARSDRPSRPIAAVDGRDGRQLRPGRPLSSKS